MDKGRDRDIVVVPSRSLLSRALSDNWVPARRNTNTNTNSNSNTSANKNTNALYIALQCNGEQTETQYEEREVKF